MSCYNATTGARMDQARPGDGTAGFTASPVAGDRKLYFTSEDGAIFVVTAGPAFELVAKNAMGVVTVASPALSEGVIHLRTRSHVVAVGK